MNDSFLRILVVEADPDTRNNLRDILEDQGHQVTLAGSIAETKALIPDLGNRFDIALLDHQLPDGHAESLLPIFRQHAPHCASIIITAWYDQDDLLLALRAGVFDYLIKPIAPRSLLDVIRRFRFVRDAERCAREAEQRASLEQMIAELAHEGRNSLNRVKLGLEALAQSFEADPDRSRLLSLSQTGCVELERLFTDLRGQSGPLQITPLPCDLYQVARNAWNDLKPLWTDRAARLVIEGDPEGRFAFLDPFRIKQVFRNLFDNTLSACPDPVQIQVRCKAVTSEGKPALRITFRDNGPGFSPEIRRQAFRPFFSTKAGGTGLGLSICRRIIEAHGGWISLANVSQGAEFIIHLPTGHPVPSTLPATFPITNTQQSPTPRFDAVPLERSP